MTQLCRVASTALLALASAFALADPADFKTHVLDPPSTSFPTTPILSSPFLVTFTPCQAGELPGNNTADGCFAGVNRTGTDWLGLEFAFSNTAALGSQPVDCSLAPSNNVYRSTSCGLDPTSNTYFLDFDTGVIKDGELFFVTEEGVDPALFPTGTATVTASTATPEPTSLVLLLTGMPAAGAALRQAVRRRKNGSDGGAAVDRA